MTTTENITTDTDIAYAVGTAANAWSDTDYWVDETGETGETIAYLAEWWLDN